MDNRDWSNRIIDPQRSLIHAMKKMDQIEVKSLIVVTDNLFTGVLSIGDIQRGIIQGIALDDSLEVVLRPNTRVAKGEDSLDKIQDLMVQYRMEICPVVDDNSKILRVYFWEDFFPKNDLDINRRFNIPVVVMAGGFGTRMRPLTYVLPKPLIPIGAKTILEEIFERFNKYGCDNFYTSINYKADFIQSYIEQLNLPYEIDFFREPEPLGTAGSIKLLSEKLNSTFFVHNCDILIETDYSRILDYHQDRSNEITIIAVIKHFSFDYGTIETGVNSQLIKLVEKPNLTFNVNSGMYILESHLINEIPNGKFFHITDLIALVQKRGGRVGVYPVSEGSWKDIGNWDEYLKNFG